ncbi:MAG: LytR/AlgR family response regulator transcription factor [Eubacteriales bacterium]
MRLIAADDEPLALKRLEKSIREACPEAEVFAFEMPSELLKFVQNNVCDVAFLDIKMYDMTGIEIAKEIQKYIPNINIVFVTGYADYALDAMSLYPSGYIMKPVTKEKIMTEMEHLRFPASNKAKPVLRIKCFGNFEVFTPEGEIVSFERSRSKELFAYLVYRRGASCLTKEIVSVIFEDAKYDRSVQMYFQVIVSAMLNALKKVGAESVIMRNYGNISVNTSLIDCDWYNFTEFDEKSLDTYNGEFMTQYSWAEDVNGYLDMIATRAKQNSSLKDLK